MQYVVNFSAGLTSFWAIKCTIERYGRESTHVVFADTKGKKDADNPHAGEDQDSYRFLRDTARYCAILCDSDP